MLFWAQGSDGAYTSTPLLMCFQLPQARGTEDNQRWTMWLGPGSVILLLPPCEQKRAQPFVDFSFYEIFLEMEKEGLVGKFWINLPSHNYDKWLIKPVSWFYFVEDKDWNISINQVISIAKNSYFLLKFHKNSNILMRLGKGRFK